jgi:hypothetical protein
MPQIMGTFHSYHFSTVTTAIMVLNVFIIKNACSFGYKRGEKKDKKGRGKKTEREGNVRGKNRDDLRRTEEN